MELKPMVAAGTVWMFSSTVFVRALDFVIKILLARLLVPNDFGLVAIGLLVVNTVGLFRNHEVGQALIYKHRDRKAADSAFIMQPLIAVVLFALIYASAPLVADFFNADVVWVVRILALMLLFDSFAVVPASLLERDLLFKRRAIPEIASTLCYAVIAVYLALNGFGVWSIVWGYLSSSFIRTVVLWMLCPWRPKFSFNRGVARSLLAYSMPLISANIIIFANTNLDDAIVGRLFSATVLGFYSLAYMFANLPATQITHVVGKVMFPVYSRLKDDVDSFRTAYMKTLSYVTLLSFPAAFGIMGLFHDFIVLFIGVKWLPAVPLVWVLCIYGLVRSVGATTGGVFQGSGKPRLVALYALVQLIVFIVLLMPAAITLGVIGIALAAVVSVIVCVAASLQATSRIIKSRYRSILYVLANHFILSAIAASVFLVSGGQTLAIFTLKTSVFCLIYITLNLAFNRGVVNGLYSDMVTVFKR